MRHRRLSFAFKNILLFGLSLFSTVSYASFIESTMGAAVVDDATATYFNPAALTLLKKPQFITLVSAPYSHSTFRGQFIQTATGFTQSGSSNDQTHYFLPSIYLGIPTHDKITIGLAVISNFFNKDVDENSILRYVQSSNRTQNYDFIPAVGIQLNKILSVGAGINFSYASLLLQPVSGFPSLHIPDGQSRNECSGTGFGEEVGFLLKLSRKTLIGLNYRSAITYHFNGSSILKGSPDVTSNHYSFDFWTPARIVLSINQFITSNLGVIATVQRIQWSIFKDIDIRGIATQVGSRTLILNANVPYHMRDTWLLTLGSYYRINPKWVVRIAGSYNQSAGNGSYQIANGNSFTLGGSTGYELYKNIIIDGSYAHTFIQNASIHIANRNIVNGVSSGSLDGISLKLTFNLA